nr:hypothetical protein CFP56_76021 [Quercus suber]
MVTSRTVSGFWGARSSGSLISGWKGSSGGSTAFAPQRLRSSTKSFSVSRSTRKIYKEDGDRISRRGGIISVELPSQVRTCGDRIVQPRERPQLRQTCLHLQRRNQDNTAVTGVDQRGRKV